MTYIAQRDAILVHAAAAAAAADATWTDVAIGLARATGRCVRVFYGGEAAPARMGGARVLNGELVSETVIVAAFLPLADSSIGAYKAAEDQAFAFKHELRTRVLGDSQLGGASTDLLMSYAVPDVVVSNNARWLVLEAEFTTDFTEYTLAP
jgi:hypothetical protein